MCFRRQPKVQTELEGTAEQIIIKIDEKTKEKQNEKEIEKILDNTVSRKTWETSSFEGVCVLCSMYSSLYNDDIVTSPKERNQLVCISSRNVLMRYNT